jgi:hypothetical protein
VAGLAADATALADRIDREGVPDLAAGELTLRLRAATGS